MRIWHKTAGEIETQGQTQPWYLQGETVAEPRVTPVLPLLPPAQETPTHFEPQAAERILARAGLLQETQRQTLSKDQIEAIAAEIGIEAEFVRVAMEQEAAGVLSRQQTMTATETVQDAKVFGSGPLAATMAVYGVSGTALMTLARHDLSLDFTWFLVVLAYVPAFFALLSGFLCSRRRQGLAWGAGFGAAAAGVGILSWKLSGTVVHFSAADYQLIAWMIGVGALLGLIGAETRRQVSRRRVKKRGRRTAGRV